MGFASTVDSNWIAAQIRDVTPIDIAQQPIVGAPFRVYRAHKAPGEALPPHAHAEGQLTFAASGLVQVRTDGGLWLVPSQLAAWVPPGVPHQLEIMTDAELWMVHLRPSALHAWGGQPALDRPYAIRVTPLLRLLFEEAVSIDHTSQKAELIVRLMLHELSASEDAPTFLPLPASALGKRVAELALADRQNRLGIAELAEGGATSVRSVSRLFPAETGLTFKAWRQRARIVHAMDRLGMGTSIAKVSVDCGFANTAAFSCAFRQVTGLTPTAFSNQAERRKPQLPDLGR